MKFLIKNYSKDADNNKEILATVLFEVETIKEAQEKMAEFITKIKDNWKTELNKNNKSIAAAMIVNLYHILDGLDIENYRKGNHEEFISKFDSHTRNVVNPTEKPIVAFLNDLMLKQESEADCMVNISWRFNAKEESKIDFANSTCDISGLYFSDPQEDQGLYSSSEKVTYNIWNIPLTKFEKYVKKIPDAWLDEDAGIFFSARNY